MQEIKQLVFKLGTMSDPSQGVLSGDVADQHIGSYLSQGFRLFAVNTGAFDPTTGSIIVHYTLTRDSDAVETVSVKNGTRAKVNA